MIEYTKMNSQNAIGKGVVNLTGVSGSNNSSLTGSTQDGTGMALSTVNDINGTETTYTENGKVSVCYRGIENPWGNIDNLIQAINIWGDGTMNGGQIYICDDFNFNETAHSGNYRPTGIFLPNTSGWANAIGYSNEEFDWLLIPSETTGNSELPVGDQITVSSNLNGYKVCNFGGYSTDSSRAGAFRYGMSNGTTGGSSRSNCRLLFVPDAKGV